ncbi:hypothetical protein AYO20_09721 [Fonsecaea nubica]|uniref:Uncharacterized protein n=1 Tax=Fonsecaea nubica TaxID=856822 RepID=A0A178CCG2_9EURO|nr:hypothetical protein AYO20_09721 [Fonsecaea nubica]OAL27648.1 hypothetical protein AYO20_09721 [Fonsecaea nubica]
MSFTDATESFFLDAVSSICQPIVQILPLNDAEVFDYLDAHPDALSRYLAERSGISEYFSTILADKANSRGRPAVGNVSDPFTDEQAVNGIPSGAIQDDAMRLAVVAGQALADDGDVLMSLDYEEEDDGEAENEDEYDADDDEQGGGWESDSDGDGPGYESNDRSNEDSDSEENGTTTSNEMSSEAGPVTPSNINTASSAPSNSADEGEDDHDGDEDGQELGFMPYPAPAHLVAASRLQHPTRSWALWEEEACIRHMLDIHRERQLKGEARFREALSRMQLQDGVTRTGHSAVKNFWNRVGRARSSFDERRNKSAPLATSKQGRRSKSESSSLLSQRRRTTRASSSHQKPRSTRRRRSPESWTDEDASEYTLDSDNEGPVHSSTPRKLKDRDDSDDEWRPGSVVAGTVTAV